MSNSGSILPLDSFPTFGDLLKYLRKRARLTQRELAIAVKYSEAQISRLEQNQRLPELSVLAALFIPALYIDDEPETIARLVELATQARGESSPERGTITFSRSTQEESTETIETEFPSNNLPLPLNSFIGRRRERDEIKEWLDGKARLVTLTGIGGCGKTRLAQETAREMLPTYRDGIWMVELASISNPSYIVQAVNTALGAPDPHDELPGAALIKYLDNKHLLLIFDNCEQIISAVAQLAEDLLRTCPRLQILATSREVFNLLGEMVLQVQPLSLPKENTADDSDSTRLFLDRARSILPAFQPDEKDASSIAQICLRLDGIPLAIELAASRLSALSVQQIAARLDDRFKLLTTGSRTALPRQQTLRAAIDWSYDLLSEHDQQLFSRLSVFSGGFSLEAANTVLAESSDDTVDVISRFVDKSLVAVDRLFSQGENRYRLLETVREYVREKLHKTGEETLIRTRHFQFFLDFARRAEQGLHGRNHVLWIKRLEQEHDNLRAAMEFTLAEGSAAMVQSGLRLANTLGYFWFLRGYYDESRHWFEQFMQSPHQPHFTAEFASLLCRHARWDDDAKKALRLFDESLALGYALKDVTVIAETHHYRARYGWLESEPSAALHHFEQSLAYSRQAGDRWLTARTLAELGEFAQVRLDDRLVARRSYEESLQIARELEDIRSIGNTLVHLGDLAIEQNKLDETRAYSSEGLVVAGELNDMESMSWGLDNLGIVAMSEGRYAEAERLCTESLLLSQEWGNGWHTIIRRHWLGRVYYFKGDERKALELFEENRSESQKVNFDWGYAASMHEAGCAALRAGDLEKAGTALTEAIQVLHKGHYGYSLAYALDACAALALAQGQPERAQILLGAADTYRESIHTDLLPPERMERDTLSRSVQAFLSPEAISSFREQGRGMTHDEAVEFALNQLLNGFSFG